MRNPQAYGIGSSSKISYRSRRNCKLSIEILKVFACLNTKFWFENQVKINKTNLIKFNNQNKRLGFLFSIQLFLKIDLTSKSLN